MYTPRIEHSHSKEVLKAVQAVIQENDAWTYEVWTGTWAYEISVSTPDIRELKRLVDILESDEFMKNAD